MNKSDYLTNLLSLFKSYKSIGHDTFMTRLHILCNNYRKEPYYGYAQKTFYLGKSFGIYQSLS